jgi:hypothetical protein
MEGFRLANWSHPNLCTALHRALHNYGMMNPHEIIWQSLLHAVPSFKDHDELGGGRRR